MIAMKTGDPKDKNKEGEKTREVYRTRKISRRRGTRRVRKWKIIHAQSPTTCW